MFRKILALATAALFAVPLVAHSALIAIGPGGFSGGQVVIDYGAVQTFAPVDGVTFGGAAGLVQRAFGGVGLVGGIAGQGKGQNTGGNKGGNQRTHMRTLHVSSWVTKPLSARADLKSLHSLEPSALLQASSSHPAMTLGTPQKRGFLSLKL